MKIESYVALNLMKFDGPNERAKLMLGEFFKHKTFLPRFEDNELLKASEELKKADKLGVKIITFEDGAFPEHLKQIKDPPILIYVKASDLSIFEKPCVAVVGSRKCTAYGAGIAHSLASELAERGVVIVSGLAYGIDAEAHKGALEAGGCSIAVLGCGANVIYPKGNKKLFWELASNGAVVSEFPLDTKPLQYNFPYRNRLISGLSVATVVVEAEEKSGSLITAGFAIEQGRDVFAVPGNITSRFSKGTNKLIKDGAFPLTSIEDVFTVKELAYLSEPTESLFPEFTEDEKGILNAIENNPLSLDEISEATNLNPTELLRIITMLEYKRAVKREGGRYVKII